MQIYTLFAKKQHNYLNYVVFIMLIENIC